MPDYESALRVPMSETILLGWVDWKEEPRRFDRMFQIDDRCPGMQAIDPAQYYADPSAGEAGS